MAKLERYSLDGFPDWDDPQYDGDVMAGFAADSAALDKLRAVSDALPEGEIVGALLNWSRGDGRAYYVVTKERPLTLAWVPTGDRYSVEAALIRGLTKADVLAMQQHGKVIGSLFGRSKHNMRTEPGQ